MDETFERQKKVLYDLMCDSFYIPMKRKELAAFLQVPKERRRELNEALDALTAEGKISLTQNGKYSKNKAEPVIGVYRAHPKGFGFVSVEGQDEDIFIKEENTGGAFHLDTVSAAVTDRPEGRSREGKIVKILARGITKVVGYYEKPKHKSYGFVIPDNQKILQDIFIPEGQDKGAVNGHKVVADLTFYGDGRRSPEGKITEILGHINDPGTDILSIVKAYDIPDTFPERVLRQAEKVPEEISEADMAGRKDLRTWQMVTIDGEDAKDLDDAVSLYCEDGNYVLGVHIADVSNYVQAGSALDQEAFKRGTSVYLADRVIPMLPHRLSNGICSLNEGADRLALSCIVTVNPKGQVVSHEIAETVIRVDKRMTYETVNRILTDGFSAERKLYGKFVPMLEEMGALSKILRKKRRRRGSIDFDFPEAKIRLDETGKPVEICPYERNAATKLIEDFMLLANETVAETYFWQELPFLYRTHDKPDEDKIRRLAVFINNFGYSMHISNQEVRPKEIQKLLGKIEGTPEEDLISRLALRSMKQAKYTTEDTGHFGLAAEHYTHFTSPIRRYPDLQIHRIIKDTLRGRMNGEKISRYQQILPEAAKQSSETERRAEEAERETLKLKKAEYMSRHLGEVFAGIISGITKWGMYVELPNTVEGLVHVSNMRDDHYEYYEELCEMRGIHLGKSYKLGQKIYVKVTGADKVTKTVDFEIAGKGDIEDGEDERENDCQ